MLRKLQGGLAPLTLLALVDSLSLSIAHFARHLRAPAATAAARLPRRQRKAADCGCSSREPTSQREVGGRTSWSACRRSFPLAACKSPDGRSLRLAFGQPAGRQAVRLAGRRVLWRLIGASTPTRSCSQSGSERANERLNRVAAVRVHQRTRAPPPPVRPQRSLARWPTHLCTSFGR